MGNKKVCCVICFVCLSRGDCRLLVLDLAYLIPFVLLLAPLNLLEYSLSVEGCKRIQVRKEGKRRRYLFTQNFISGFNDYSVGVEFFPGPIEVITFSRQGIKMY